MPSKSIRKCPCGLMCKDRREAAVNFVLQNGICTSTEVKNELRKKGLGESAIRKSLRFLSCGQCKQVDLLAYANSRKRLQFPKQGRVYFARTIRRRKINRKIISLLTNLQTQILKKFSMHSRDIYYFSLYELRKLFPYAGTSVDYAIHRLCNLGLVQRIRIKKIPIYSEPKNIKRLKKQSQEAVIENRTEFAIVKIVHELIMNLYPLRFIADFKGAMRPSTERILRLTGGMTFDLFYQLSEPIGNKRFLAIDVYTRIPVNGYVVNSFLRKIEWARTKSGAQARYNLKDKTFGMIVFRNATGKAIEIANENGIRFIRLSDIKIDYEGVRRKTASLL